MTCSSDALAVEEIKNTWLVKSPVSSGPNRTTYETVGIFLTILFSPLWPINLRFPFFLKLLGYLFFLWNRNSMRRLGIP